MGISPLITPHFPTVVGFNIYGINIYGFNIGAQRDLGVDTSKTPMMRGTKPELHGAGYLTNTFSRESAAFIERHHTKPFILYLSFNAPRGPLTATDADKKNHSSI